MSHLVVTGDGNVHVSQWGVGVAQGNGGDVYIGSLSQWLMVSTGVCHNQEARLSESCLDLIGEGTRGEATMEGGGTSGRGKLQHCSLKWAERTSCNKDLCYIYQVLTTSRIQLWLKLLSNASHGTAVLVVSAKTQPDHSCTLPTPEHRHQCPALTECI